MKTPDHHSHTTLTLRVLVLSVGLGLFTIPILPSLNGFAVTRSEDVYWRSARNGVTHDVETMATSMSNPVILYAGTWTEGVYRSSDQGASWQPANSGISLPMSIQGGLAVNPVVPTIVYAGDYYGGGLYRSEDGGDSWSLSLPGAAVRAIAINPFMPTLVLVGDREDGLYRSTDDGDTWTPITVAAGFTDSHVRALSFAQTTPGIAYAGASDIVFCSEDAGQTWANQGTLPSNIQALAVHPITSSLVYAGSFAHGLHRSDDSCIIRPMPTIDSDACRPPVPEHADQQFRCMASTFSWSLESVVALLRN
jgi:hypothetical protein